ncbi:MAG TPA: DUF1289 domain-containing protein [Woeseiaceae bacterium]|nr:DUF1289 domain-containing protein [Woeseiaceae bacterium]
MKSSESERPLSPCVLLCTLDERGVCLGCHRTLAEISRWSLMTAAEQWQLIDELTTRKARNAATMPPAKGD